MNNFGGKITPLIGDSDFTHNICNLISTISKNFASVLLIGERGSGKRLIAQHIHNAFALDSQINSFNKKDFYEINCKSFSESDIRLVFGGISRFVPEGKKVTLFVNFVNELSTQLQVDFFNTIIKARENGVNLKIICSSEINFEEDVLSGKFSTDLYYLINSVVLNTQPLRLRKDDILPIAEYYRELFKKQSGLDFVQFSDMAKEELTLQYWKGNIDELINSIQRAFLVGNEKIIKTEDLGLVSSTSVNADVTGYGLEDKSLKNAINSFKKDYVTKVLEENDWNQTKTARILGIQRTYVIKLINELGIKK